MTARLVTDWCTAFRPLYAPFPAGELRMQPGAPPMPYLGPGVAA